MSEYTSLWVDEITSMYDKGTYDKEDSSKSVSIHRAPKFLKDLNEAAYIPRVVPLGLFHHRPTESPSEMDRRKMGAVLRMKKRLPLEKQQQFLHLFNDSFNSFIKSCYEEDIETENSFISWTCLLDGWFMLEILGVLDPAAENILDPVYNPNRIKSCQFDILCDFFILENQIPIDILVQLLKMEHADAPKKLYTMLLDTTTIIHPFLPKRFPEQEKPEWNEAKDGNLHEYKHILGVFHSFVSGESKPPKQPHTSRAAKKWKKWMTWSQKGQEENEEQQQFLESFITASASELFSSGLRFKSYYGIPSNEKITLRKQGATLTLPTLFITDTSEMIFRNLMAFEVFQADGHKEISYYVLLMNELIEEEKDVAVLRRAGVIQSSMGTDSQVATLLNGLCKGLNLQDLKEDPYIQIKMTLNKWYSSLPLVKLNLYLQQHPKLLKNIALFWAVALVIASASSSLYPLYQRYLTNAPNH
ncbi:hypothetical protein SUGI_1192820 [Cryptomeria japonica]|uniref:uncharacterized protein LOC131063117 n=1 Tax=Cryptomeria japonica TaxID=3369 RepID=UPI0024147405|nr:uncharacterized protein LOC131063117 [Cryptomeria japonica]GLJ55536.1 hypothetical protein SUGI_1192820 [Cryptomeria japonica]